MSQPPLSRLIKNLENDLGFQLFVRNRRYVVLTEAGAAFVLAVRDLLAMAESAIARERQNGTYDARVV
jgi:LysR family transcriptional regulator, glycine cleavage system transcriptional activator